MTGAGQAVAAHPVTASANSCALDGSPCSLTMMRDSPRATIGSCDLWAKLARVRSTATRALVYGMPNLRPLHTVAITGWRE